MASPKDQKIDFLDFQKDLIEKYGEDRCDLESIKKIAMVTFREQKDGKITGRYGASLVFVDTPHRNLIADGDTWFCELKSNGLNINQFIAAPLMKFDANFMYSLYKDNYDKLIQTVWEKHREDISSDLEVIYAEKLEEKAEELAKEILMDREAEVVRLTVSLDDAIARIAELESDTTAEEYRQKNLDLEAMNMLLKEKNDELHLEIAALKDMRCHLEREVSEIRHKTVMKEPSVRRDAVIRTDADTLYSPAFTEEKYRVLFSADKRTMHIVADKEGKATCVNNVMKLRGLEDVIPFNSPGELNSRISRKSGRCLIELD